MNPRATMRFNRIIIVSNRTRKAAQFIFSPKYNLILSNEKNSVGKSSVVKNILWCFGCEPRLDDDWKKLECRVVLEFQVDDVFYRIAREGSTFIISQKNQLDKVFSGISNGLSAELAKLFKFAPLLPTRNQEDLVTPPPAFYFLPFYIDQKHSWSSAWASFDKLGQFSNWKSPIIKYHTGMINSSHFNVTEEIYKNKKTKAFFSEKIFKYDSALSLIGEAELPAPPVATADDFFEMEEQIAQEISELQQSQESTISELIELRTEKSHIEAQLKVALESLLETTEDYEFSYKLDENLECPTCGTMHDNSLIRKFSLLQDKEQATDIARRLSNSLDDLTENIRKKGQKIIETGNAISTFNDRWSISDSSNGSDIIQSIASDLVVKRLSNTRGDFAVEVSAIDAINTSLVNTQNKQSAVSRKKVKKKFSEIFPEYISRLKAVGIDSQNINSPEQHAKVSKSGGAAESTRGMLAYYLSIYNLINEFSEEVLAPLIIDTPNQHEQAAKHYDSIVSLLMENTPSGAQLFICGMDSQKLDPIKNLAQVFFLEEEHALLSIEEYRKCSNEVNDIFAKI